MVLKYQNNFADNLSELAYAKILEANSEKQCYFENSITKRQNFEYKMSNFNMDYKYISTNQVKSIAEKSYLFSRKLVNPNKITKEFQNNNKYNKILDVNHFKIDDIDLITDNIKEQFNFKNTDFIVNFDILDEINSVNSIGVYINKNDLAYLDYDYLYNAANRLNKYLRKPKLFIFTNKINIDENNLNLKYKTLNLLDWREEFYFLTRCKNKIIIPTLNSYSENFWSAILNKSTNLVAYDKNIKAKKFAQNWIGI